MELWQIAVYLKTDLVTQIDTDRWEREKHTLAERAARISGKPAEVPEGPIDMTEQIMAQMGIKVT